MSATSNQPENSPQLLISKSIAGMQFFILTKLGLQGFAKILTPGELESMGSAAQWVN